MGRLGLGLGLGLGIAGGAAAPPAWSPVALGAKLVAWWDAEAPASLSMSGAAVGGWADLTNGITLSQTVSGFKPTWSATGMNGRPCVTFDGTDDRLGLIGGFPSNFPTGSAAGEIWALASLPPASNAGNMFLLTYGSGGWNGRGLRRTLAGGVPRTHMFSGDGSVPLQSSPGSVDATGIHVVRGIVTGTHLVCHTDGIASPATACVPATGASTIIMGSSVGGAEYLNGALNSVIFTAPLTEAEAAQLLTYQKLRGGIS